MLLRDDFWLWGTKYQSSIHAILLQCPVLTCVCVTILTMEDLVQIQHSCDPFRVLRLNMLLCEDFGPGGLSTNSAFM